MIREVASLNTLAVSWLQSNRHDDALALLNKIMQLTHIAWPQEEESESDMWHSEVAPSISCLPRMEAEASHNPFNVYARPFLIKDSTFIDVGVISVTLSFNTGLTYHHRGLANNCSADLKYALESYERALSAVQLNAREGFASNGLYWLTLVLLTIKASILWHFCDVKKALSCQKRVQMLLTVNCQGSFALPIEDSMFFERAVWEGYTFGVRKFAPAA